MASVTVETEIRAPRERVFDLARDVGVHVASMAKHGERVVAGVSAGLLELGDETTFRSRHFGIPLELTSRITELDRPRRFREEMAQPPFRRLVHEHRFEERDGVTVMTDVFEFVSPLGPLGRLVDALVVGPYLRRGLRDFARAVKEAAERPALH